MSVSLCIVVYYFRDCKDCRMLTAGNYDKTQSYSINSGKVKIYMNRFKRFTLTISLNPTEDQPFNTREK